MATKAPYTKVAYGLSEPLLDVSQQPIIAKRDPRTDDRAQIGAEWINTLANTAFLLTSVVDNVSTWIPISSATSVLRFDADSGSALPVAGVINVDGAGDVSTSASGNTVVFTGRGVTSITSDSGTATVSSNNITLAGGSGVTTSASGSTVTISATGGGSGIITIDGNTGSVTGSTVTLTTGNVGVNGNAFFSGSGTTMTLNSGDSNDNVAWGPFSLGGSSTGTNNTAIGWGSGGLLTTGSSNTFLGKNSGNVTTGSSNCGVGINALSSATSAAFNVAIGDSAGASLTSSERSNIYLNARGVASESNVLRIGSATSSGDQNLLQAFICGIDGVNVGSVAKVVTMASDQLGTATIIAGSGISVTPGANTITIAATGGGSGITDITGNTGGAQSGPSITLTTGASNINGTAVFAGSANTIRLNATDVNTNTGWGHSSLASGSLSGSANSCFGYSSGENITTGDSNTLIGTNAGLDITVSPENTAVGVAACGQLNNGTGGNTAVGFGAFDGITGGSFNVGIGYLVGHDYTGVESSNILVGYNTLGTLGESHVLRIGNGTGNSTAGNLNAAHICGIQGITVTGSAVLVSTSDQLGVAASSKRFKSNIQDMGDASSVLYNLRPVSFTWNTDSSPGLKDASQNTQYGLIAEEAVAHIPHAVNLDKEGLPFNINYHDLIGMLINEVQRLNKRIKALEAP